jgi:transposase-like protein
VIEEEVMDCPHCQSQQVVKNDTHRLQDGGARQNDLCRSCHKRFSERTGTPMARLRTPTETVSLALKMRGEGMGVRASGRVLDKSHSTILRWQERMSRQESKWSPAAPEGGDITLEHDELYTRVGENLPPQPVSRMDDHQY